MQQTTLDAKPKITISVVSHGHGFEVERLICQALEEDVVHRVVLTLNRPEALDLPDDERLFILQNTSVKGFGANHNTAFTHCTTPYFCVLNPDIVLLKGSFDELITCLNSTQAAVVGPMVISPDGKQEDSWRRFPTLRSLSLKALGHDTTVIRSNNDSSPAFPDWVAGMCMLFRSTCFSQIGGFDERFFLYYEDVDICGRLWQNKQSVTANPTATVIHNAHRASRCDWEHMRWHAMSMARYFGRYWCRLPSPEKKHPNAGNASSV